MAFDRLEPLPDLYFLAGLICSTIANVMGSGKKKFAPIDFMPESDYAKGKRQFEKLAENIARFTGNT